MCQWTDCPRRGDVQSSRSALVTHARTHTGEKPFKCSVGGCNARFSRQDNMTKHIKAHEQGKITLDETGMPEKQKPAPRPRQSGGGAGAARPKKESGAAAEHAAVQSAAAAQPPSAHKTTLHVSAAAPLSASAAAAALSAATAAALARNQADPYYAEYRKQLDRFRFILAENESLEDQLRAAKVKIQRLQKMKQVLLDDVIRERVQATS